MFFLIDKNKWLIGLFLFVVGVGLYHRVVSFEFVFYDDPTYINAIFYNSKNIWDTILWAFTDIINANWSPLTILSLLFDFKIYGVNAGGYHFTNIVLHCFNVVILFFILCKLLKNTTAAFFVAFLFLVHPINVETAVWISERKGLLASFFTLLSLNYYLKFISTTNKYFYCLSLILFLFGLMSKSVFVVLPLLFVLISWYECDSKKQQFNVKKEFIVVIPFLLLAVAFGFFTIYIHSKSGAIISNEFIPFTERVYTASNSYIIYLKQIFYPFNLSVNYEYKLISLRTVIINVISTVFILSVAYKTRVKYKYLAFGILWYTIMILPVLGFVQSGLNFHADRYLYLPGVGIYLIIVLSLREFLNLNYVRPLFVKLGCSILLGVLILLTWMQYSNWKTSIHLFEHAYSIDNNNYVANSNLANVYIIKGNYSKGLEHYNKARKIAPTHSVMYFMIADNLILLKKYDLALTILNDFLDVNNNNSRAMLAVAKIRIQQGEYNYAIKSLNTFTSSSEKFPESIYLLAYCYFKNDDYSKALDFMNVNVNILNQFYPEKSQKLIKYIRSANNSNSKKLNFNNE